MSSNPRRSSPSNDTDIFDDFWTSITDATSEFTRSLVGLPMFYRHTENPTLLDILPVFAEPGILSPKCITFHLDKDVAAVMGPFRFVSRPVTVFDIFSQGWRNEEGRRFGSGMMFLFGSPVENARWLGAPGLRGFHGDFIFRPWNFDRDYWIRKSILHSDEDIADLDFEELEHESMQPDSRLPVSPEPQSTSTFEQHWKDIMEECSKTESLLISETQDFEKLFKHRFRDIETDTPRTVSGTSTSTHTIRNADGSIYKETITSEILSDGSLKTTRIVNTIPPGGDSQQSTTETTVNTTPPVVSEKRTWKRSGNDEEKAKMKMERCADEKKGNEDQRSWAWWFWSRK